MGNFYNSHAELLVSQAAQREYFYAKNNQWWQEGGYGGSTDDEEMVGDETSSSDCLEGLAFLDGLIQKNNKDNKDKNINASLMQHKLAVDVGAGLGRVTKGILLKHYDEIHLVEGSSAYSKRSKIKLGKKKAKRCVFTQCYLQDINSQTLGTDRPIDLIWVQWTLQYLTDCDVIECLKILAESLRPVVGVLVVKENRPFGLQREDRFQMDTPAGEYSRYDITRHDAHHRLLFRMAGLTVGSTERGEETNTYELRVEK
ncbi:Lys N-methyltransferase 1 [Seminavis robusta]|uniref:Alpha N-terminal protein methyltransferase 1 n=1 Tax=Seminavis robusta TaxID=568900 RepID=A0A9N8DB81_9STRA|nr:Lys N-methyltransferase 1 [Seminavis robusta]|eukprot:Sro73_g040250.1 Lys N-methyltransferase 1 (257) ;mRNA; f:22006-22776